MASLSPLPSIALSRATSEQVLLPATLSIEQRIGFHLARSAQNMFTRFYLGVCFARVNMIKLPPSSRLVQKISLKHLDADLASC